MLECQEQTQPTSRRRVGLAALAVFGVGCLMGWPALRGEFLSGDDVHLVLDHVLVNHPSITHAVELVTIIHRDLYQPIPMLSFSLDFALIGALGLTPETIGPAAGAWVFHLTNVLIHAANGVLVLWLFWRLHRRLSVGVVAATLFAVHPYAAEVVGWLNGRMMLLATFFSLASIIALDGYLCRGKWWRAAAALAFVVLAMSSKVRVGLPLLLLIPTLYRRVWPDRRWWSVWLAAALLTAGFTALNIISTAVSEMFQGAAQTLHGSRIVRTVLVLAWYLTHYVWPVGMSPWHPPEKLVLWSHPGLPLAAIVIVCVGLAVAFSWRRSRVGVLGLGWFLATVASTLPLIPSRDVMAADRYVYLPNVGLHWIVAALAVQAVTWVVRRYRMPSMGYLAGAVGAAGAVAVMSYTRVVLSYYESNVAKAGRIAEVYPDEPGVWETLGWAYYREGQYVSAIDKARIDLEKHPKEMACETLQLIGMSEYRLGRVDEALVTLQRAVEADPAFGKTYSRLGLIHYELGDYAQAERYYLKAMELMPEYLPGAEALGHVYRKLNRPDEAARWYERGLELNDFDPVCVMALAEMEMAEGDYATAIDRFERLLSWQPENTVARTNLGVCYVEVGRTSEAMSAYDEVLRRRPGSVTARLNLAALKAGMGDATGAVALLAEGLRQAPTDRRLLVAAHDLLASLGRLRESARYWAAALKVEPQAADLAAWYAWTCALAKQWPAGRTAIGAALKEDPGQSLALAARVLAELADENPEAARVALDRMLAGLMHPPDVARRLRDAVVALGQADPEKPWPYYFAARLLMAEGQMDQAKLGVEEFVRRCDDPAWQQRATDLLSDGSPD
ncbi:MAG: tetratricopeptide repeat protein [Phycisphaerae bacterium]